MFAAAFFVFSGLSLPRLHGGMRHMGTGEASQAEKQRRFTRLMLRYHAGIVRFCRLRLPDDPFACEEVVQDVFTVLYERLDTLYDDAHLSGWLYQTADNLVKKARHQRMRGEKHERAVDWEAQEAAGVPLPPQLTYEARFHAAEEKADVPAALRRVLDQLSAEERMLWRRYFQQGCPLRVMSEEMRVGEAAVKSRIHRLRQKLTRLARKAL